MATYGESMAAKDREEDERYWKMRCQRAMEKKDKEIIGNLINEGLEEQFDESIICDLQNLKEKL